MSGAASETGLICPVYWQMKKETLCMHACLTYAIIHHVNLLFQSFILAITSTTLPRKFQRKFAPKVPTKSQTYAHIQQTTLTI